MKLKQLVEIFNGNMWLYDIDNKHLYTYNSVFKNDNFLSEYKNMKVKIFYVVSTPYISYLKVILIK